MNRVFVMLSIKMPTTINGIHEFDGLIIRLRRPHSGMRNQETTLE